MEIIKTGTLPTDEIRTVAAYGCTQEPGDNCWIKLD